MVWEDTVSAAISEEDSETDEIAFLRSASMSEYEFVRSASSMMRAHNSA